MLDHVEKGYLEGKSLRVLAAETDRSQGAGIRVRINGRDVVRYALIKTADPDPGAFT